MSDEEKEEMIQMQQVKLRVGTWVFLNGLCNPTRKSPQLSLVWIAEELVHL